MTSKTNNKEGVVIFSTLEKTLKQNKFTDNDIKIIKASHEGLRFCNYKTRKAAIGDIGAELSAWLYLLGIKLPSNKEILLLNAKIADLIIDYFPMLTKFDLQIAINMSIADKLPTDNNHYNNFSPIYVSRILNSYNEYKGGIILRYQALINEMEEEKRNRVTTDDKERILIKGVMRTFNEFQKNGDFLDSQASIYKYLVYRGYVEKITDEQLGAYMSEADRKLKADVQDSSNSSMMRKLISGIMSESKTYDEKLKVEAKNLHVKNFYSKVIDDKKTITEIINKEIERIGL